MAKSLQELASENPDSGLPDLLKQRYNEGLRDVAGGLWKNTIKVASSSFGKGVLLTAFAFLAVSAIGLGAVAASGGALGAVTLNVAGLAVPASFSQAVTLGLSAAAHFLASGFGLGTLAVGGMVGTAVGLHKEHTKINAEMAKVQAEMFEAMRNSKAAEPPPSKSPDKPKASTPAQAETAQDVANIANMAFAQGFASAQELAKRNPYSTQAQSQQFQDLIARERAAKMNNPAEKTATR